MSSYYLEGKWPPPLRPQKEPMCQSNIISSPCRALRLWASTCMQGWPVGGGLFKGWMWTSPQPPYCHNNRLTHSDGIGWSRGPCACVTKVRWESVWPGDRICSIPMGFFLGFYFPQVIIFASKRWKYPAWICMWDMERDLRQDCEPNSKLIDGVIWRFSRAFVWRRTPSNPRGLSGNR